MAKSLGRVFREMDMFPMFISLKYRGHNSFKTICGAVMTIVTIVTVLTYGCLRIFEMSSSINTYTVVKEMGAIIEADNNRFEISLAF